MTILWALQSFVPSIEDLIVFYNDASLTIFERNAPLISKRISTKPRWLNSSLIESRRKVRRAERLWRATKIPQHRESYQKARKIIIKELFVKKKEKFGIFH
jgi:hypothetical protein